jgi:hypothetical protein
MIFHSYVSLPEGNYIHIICGITIFQWFSQVFSHGFPHGFLLNVPSHCLPGHVLAGETSSRRGRASQWLGGAGEIVVGRYIWGWVKALVPTQLLRRAGNWMFIPFGLNIIVHLEPPLHGNGSKVIIDHLVENDTNGDRREFLFVRWDANGVNSRGMCATSYGKLRLT